LNTHINRRQTGNAQFVFPDQVTWPTMMFRDALTQRFGDLEVRYRAARGETDDHCYLFIPERAYLFTGDLVIWASANCGNPRRSSVMPSSGRRPWRQWRASALSGSSPDTDSSFTSERRSATC